MSLGQEGKNESEKGKSKKGGQAKSNGICQAGCRPPAYRMSRGMYVQDEGPEAGRLQSARDKS